MFLLDGAYCKGSILKKAADNMKFVDGICSWILQKIPKTFRKKWDSYLERYFQNRTADSRENLRLRQDFQQGQIKIFLAGLTITLILGAGLFIFFASSKEIVLQRNQFGQGDKEVYLEVNHEGDKEEIALTLEEKKLDKNQERKIFQAFFQDLEKELPGQNSSLQRVNKNLNFPDTVEGYPFEITYQPENVLLVGWDGSLGEDALKLDKDQKTDTYVKVEAAYKNYTSSKSFKITLVAGEEKKLSFLERWKEQLVDRESRSRDKDSFVLPLKEDNLKIYESSRKNLWKLPGVVVVLIITLLVKQYKDLQEKDKMRHKENLKDFPQIVHLLTLYMGAGLSFPSAVRRVTMDYEKNKETTQERYAFEQIRVMNQCMEMGLRPKEVCLKWGSLFSEKMYGKFAMLLSQSLSKGSREIRFMMEQEEEKAFRIQVDQARKSGEEASTKLLFPMIALLVIVMILVTFPAMMQFYKI